MAKLGIEPDELRRDPAGRLGWVELTDGQYENMPDPIDEVVNHRELPGEGEFPIREYVAACRRPATTGRGASRSSPRSSATCRSSEIFDRSLRDRGAQLAPERSAYA